MIKGELAEWIAMIGVIIAWWPPLLFKWAPAWYRYPLYLVSIVVLGGIFLRRWTRMQEGLRESREMLEGQRNKDVLPGMPPPPGRDDKGKQ
jgi:hypothetical protein